MKPVGVLDALIIYYPDEKTWERFGDVLIKVQDVVFWDLNEGKEMIFKGEGPHWTAQVTFQFYEHFLKDTNDVLHYENNYTEKPLLKYKGTKPEEIGEISYLFETNGEKHGCRLGKPHLTEDGTISLASSGGTGHIPRENDIYNVKIEWNGQEETFELRALIQ